MLSEFAGYFAGVGESSCFKLGKNRLPIYEDIKDAFAPWNQLRLRTKGFAQFIRQTDGVGFIVSFCAVMNINFHLILFIS